MSLETLSPQELLAQGQKAELDGKFDEAIKCYVAAQKKNPRLEFVYTSLGNVYVKSKDPTRAIKAYKRSIEVKDDKHAHYNLGLLYFHLKMFKQAIKHLRAAEKKGLDEPDTYFYLAKSYFMAKDFTESEKVLEKGYEKTKNPRLKEIRESLKKEDDRLKGKYPGEKELLARLKKDPKDLKNYNELVVYYLRLNNRQRAEELLKDAVKKNPKNLAAYTNLAGFYFNEARWKDATILLEKAITVSPDEISDINLGLYVNLAQAYLKLDDQKSAIKALEKVKGLNPPKVEIIQRMIDGIKEGKAD